MPLRTLALLAVLACAAPAAALAKDVHGKAAPERITGTAKADRIDVAGGGADRVACGRGTDVVEADAADGIAADCEYVARRISIDTTTARIAQHQTEVESSAFGWGSTVVASFQVARIHDGGADAIGWSTSLDAGRTWQAGLLPQVTTATGGESPRASDPAVAYDAAHGVWLDSTLIVGDNFTSLGINRSTDGLAWSPLITAARTNGFGLAYDKNWIGCDNTSTSPRYGTCYLVYVDEVHPRLALQTSPDGGVTWSAAVTVADAFGGASEGALPLIQPNGNVTIVFNGGENGIYAVRTVDGGATFGPPVGIAALVEALQIGLRAPSLPTATVAADGRLFVAWADCKFRAGCSGDDIVLSSSADGVTWNAPSRIPTAGFDAFVPGLAADPATPGRLALVTYVRTSAHCSLDTCAYGVSYSSSLDGGATWTTPQRLDALPPRYEWIAATDGGQFVGDYVGAAFAAGRFVPVFALAEPPTRGTKHEAMFAESLP